MSLSADLTPAQQELLALPDKTESNVRAVIRAWLKEPGGGGDISSEWRTSTGPIDLYLKNRRVIIETKTYGRLKNGPEMPGTGSRVDETALEQLERYVKAERDRERLYLEDDIEDLPWIGVVTDGRKWWIWEWSSNMTNDTYSANNAWQNMTLTRTNLDSLTKMFDRKVGLEWAPDDPTSLFDDHLESLKILYEQEMGKPSLDTMKELWLRQLKASGNAPQTEHDTNDLFVLHTLLITVASTITSQISRKPTRFGFAAWISDTRWLKAVQETIAQYNWRQGTGDVLRALYMGLVDKKHRKIYGEFYTPDWLAELVCLKVLDDKWIEKCISEHFEGKYSGVLDPACGSGTFLYHAARRIVESKPVKDSEMQSGDVAEMLVQLVNGIDIHPVAVEMARANLLRAMPAIPNSGLRIWQGDSLQTDRKDSGQTSLFDVDDSLVIYSRKKRMIRLPKLFLTRSTIINDVTRLTESANNGKPFPVGLDSDLSKTDASILRDTHVELSDICRNEGNSVWAWYILNKAGPYILAQEKVSRIVANPPWVVLMNIQDENRKKEIIESANAHGIWIGGKNAARFDIASLFVIKCRSLYLHESDKSGWVLPQAAMKGSNWEKYHKTIDKYILQTFDMDNLPFKEQSKSCVNILGKGKKYPIKKLAKKKNVKFEHFDSWKDVKKKTKWVDGPKEFPVKPSRWSLDNDVSIRQGATLIPNCLVKISKKKDVKDGVEITTVQSRHNPWKKLGSKTGIIPRLWIRDVITANELLPYCISEPSQFIIPLDENLIEFDKNIMDCQYWRDADGIYQKHMGKGSSTPKTLLGNINHQNKLEKQLIRDTKCFIIYNKSGTRICASIVNSNSIVGISAYGISIKTKNESLFLTALLNTACLQNAYLNSQKTDRHFATHFWQSIPLPRYDHSNKLHVKLAKLATSAEKVAKSCPDQNRKAIRKFLCEDGVSGNIDKIVKKLLPKYVM